MRFREAETFIGSIQEDTEEAEISFEDYLAQINKQKAESGVDQTSDMNIQELDALLKSSDGLATSS